MKHQRRYIKQKEYVNAIQAATVQKFVLLMKTGLLMILLIMGSRTALAQSETDYWYFGNKAGLRFGPPENSTFPPPQILSNSAMPSTWEACAVASSETGQLLFYTNGVDIWRTDHAKMNSTALAGNSTNSGTQGALIVKRPGGGSIYYVFTGEAVETVNASSTNIMPYYYTTVDMSLNSGLGGVVTYNTTLNKGGSAFQGTEKMQAIQHANGRDVWVVLHEWHSNAFCAYLVTPAGVTTTPVVSSIGSIHVVGTGAGITAGYIENDKWQATGCMKFSPDGRYLAVVIPAINLAGTSVNNGTTGIVEIFNFNRANGSVLAPPGGIIRFSVVEPPYGVEFSPDNNLLYVVASTYVFSTSRLLQYNLRATDVASSMITISTLSSGQENGWRALQLARDGKIYMARDGKRQLGVINNPNTLGVGCNFTLQGPLLSSISLSKYTFPNFVQSFFSGIGQQALQCDVCEIPEDPGQDIPWGSLQNFTAPFSHNGDVCTLRVYYYKRTCGPYQDIKLVAIHRESVAPECDNIWNSYLTNPDGTSSRAGQFFIRWAGEELLRNAANYYGLSGSVGTIQKVRFFRSPLYYGGNDPDCSKQWIVGYDRRNSQTGAVQICCYTKLDLLRCNNAEYQLMHSDVYSSVKRVNTNYVFYRDAAMESILPVECSWSTLSGTPGYYEGCSADYMGSW